MKFEVLLTADAERDLEDLHDYIAEHDSSRAASHVLDRLLEVTAGLAVEPQGGAAGDRDGRRRRSA